jgi:hypothetical protein
LGIINRTCEQSQATTQDGSLAVRGVMLLVQSSEEASSWLLFKPVINGSKSKITNEFGSADLLDPAVGPCSHSMMNQPAVAEMLLRIQSLVVAWFLR